MENEITLKIPKKFFGEIYLEVINGQIKFIKPLPKLMAEEENKGSGVYNVGELMRYGK